MTISKKLRDMRDYYNTPFISLATTFIVLYYPIHLRTQKNHIFSQKHWGIPRRGRKELIH